MECISQSIGTFGFILCYTLQQIHHVVVFLLQLTINLRIALPCNIPVNIKFFTFHNTQLSRFLRCQHFKRPLFSIGVMIALFSICFLYCSLIDIQSSRSLQNIRRINRIVITSLDFEGIAIRISVYIFAEHTAQIAIQIFMFHILFLLL